MNQMETWWWRYLSTAAWILVTCLVLGTAGADPHDDGMARCGGHVNGSRGQISTPNFPHEFPVPIQCRWVLYAPPGHKIVLYFTQYYLRESFMVAEYTYYQDEQFNTGRNNLGEVGFDQYSLISYKPYLVIDFMVRQLGNIHLRVDEFLLDVYGFNITYEIVDNDKVERLDVCTVYRCSFLGNCLATADYEDYSCHCFRGYYGDGCQFGRYCNPEKGINFCRNDGKCRYFYGSQVNTCDCPRGFAGAQCELKDEEYSLAADCEALGHKLSADNKTCVEKGRTMYKAIFNLPLSPSLDVLIPGTTLDDLPECTPTMLKAELTAKMVEVFGSVLRDFHNLTIWRITTKEDAMEMSVYFIAESTDRDTVWNMFHIFLQNTRLCERPLDPSKLDFEPQPILHALMLRKYEKEETVEGHPLTLTCSVKGSSMVTFSWYKDQAPVHDHHFMRNMLISRDRQSDDGTHMSVLYIEKADQWDEGDYSCKVQDHFETATETVHIRVIPVPHLQVDPLSHTVPWAGEAKISCLSRDDDFDPFVYTWLKDGDPLVPTYEETPEDLFPTGSHLYLRDVKEDAVYTCVVKSAAGTVQDSCYVHVMRDGEEVCSVQDYDQVVWDTTVANNSAFKPCPRDAAGHATRACVCNKGTCQWAEPNFAHCTSISLDTYEQELHQLMLGYEVSTCDEILQDVRDHLDGLPTHRPIFSGDLEQTLRILVSMHSYLKIFRLRDAADAGYVQDNIEVMDQVTNMTKKYATPEEQMELWIGPYTMKLMDSLAEDPAVLHHGNTYFKTHLLEVKGRQMSLHEDQAGTMLLQDYNDISIHVQKGMMKLENSQAKRNVTIISGIYRDLSQTVRDDNLKFNHGPEMEVNSDIAYVNIEGDNDYFYVLNKVPVEIRFAHKHKVLNTNLNASRCVRWKAGDHVADGQWAADSCDVLQVEFNFTVCRCWWPGHYTLLSRNPSSRVYAAHELFNIWIVIGCGISLAAFILTLGTQILWWSHLKGETGVTSVSICIVMILINTILIGGFTAIHVKIVCQMIYMALFGLLLVSLLLLLVEAIYVHANCLQRVITTRFSTILLFTAWGLPVLITCIVSVLSYKTNLIYNSINSSSFCWLTHPEWQLYVFVAVIFIILPIYGFVVGSTIVHGIYRQPKEAKQIRSKYTFFVCRSLLSMVYFLAAVILSICLTSTNHHNIYQYLFPASLVALNCHAPCKIMCECLCRACAKSGGTVYKSDIIDSSSSFKAFLKPQSVSNTNDEGVGADHEECLRRDRQRYTRQKKEQLQALLGSSANDCGRASGSASSGSTTSSRLQYSTERLVPFTMCKCDKNISEKGEEDPCHCGDFTIKPFRCRSFIADPNDAPSPSYPNPREDRVPVHPQSEVVACLIVLDDTEKRKSAESRPPSTAKRGSNASASSGEVKQPTRKNSRVRFTIGADAPVTDIVHDYTQRRDSSV